MQVVAEVSSAKPRKACLRLLLCQAGKHALVEGCCHGTVSGTSFALQLLSLRRLILFCQLSLLTSKFLLTLSSFRTQFHGEEFPKVCWNIWAAKWKFSQTNPLPTQHNAVFLPGTFLGCSAVFHCCLAHPLEKHSSQFWMDRSPAHGPLAPEFHYQQAWSWQINTCYLHKF